MRKLLLFAILVLTATLTQVVAAQQQFDVAFGASTIATKSGPTDPNFATLGGGAFLNFSGDFLFTHSLGVQGEVAWRASSNVFQGFQPYRPILYDFNGIWAPTWKHVGIEAMGGIGGLSTRVYQPFYNCSFSGCTNYVSSNHFLGHIGGGIKLYVKGPFFVRPEAHLYFIRNNFEYNQDKATRFGVSIGYTLRNQTD